MKSKLQEMAEWLEKELYRTNFNGIGLDLEHAKGMANAYRQSYDKVRSLQSQEPKPGALRHEIVKKGKWQYRSEENHDDIEVVIPAEPQTEGLREELRKTLSELDADESMGKGPSLHAIGIVVENYRHQSNSEQLEDLGKLGKRKGYEGVFLCRYVDGWKLILWKKYAETSTVIILAPDTTTRESTELLARQYLESLSGREAK